MLPTETGTNSDKPEAAWPAQPEARRKGKRLTTTCLIYIDKFRSVQAEVGPNGTITSSRKYDVYGLVRGGTNPEGTSKHKFVGQLGHPSDDETGLIYMRARYMDPQLGRFIRLDPHRHGLNWYNYCNSNPVNSVDPTGCEDLAEVVIASSESMGIDGLEGLGLSELDGTISVAGDEMTVMVDWIESTGPGQFQRETFVEVLEEIAEGRNCNAIKWVGQSEEGSAGYNMKLKIAKELMEPNCFSHENGITMLYWLLQEDVPNSVGS